MIGVTEWFRRHDDAEGKRTQYLLAQIAAPTSAALATILAGIGVSTWAVIPSAIAVVASSLLASFGLRENWGRLRLMSRELGFETVLFAKGYGRYSDVAADHAARIDRFMARIDELSIRSIYAGDKHSEGSDSG
jgi:Protein of unknown function (DUF4231)